MNKTLILILLAVALTGAFVVTSLAASDQDKTSPCDRSGVRHGMTGMMGNDAPCMDDSDGDMGSMMNHRGRGHMMGQGTGNMMGQNSGHMMNHRMGMGNHHMMNGRMEQIMFLDKAENLGLNNDQVTKLKAIHSDCRKDNIHNAAEVKISRLELTDLLSTNNWALKDVETMVRKIQKLEGDIQIRQLQGVSEARKVLTTEQLKQAESATNSGDLENLFQ